MKIRDLSTDSKNFVKEEKGKETHKKEEKKNGTN